MDCPHIPITAYNQFSLRIHDKVARDRIPIGGSVEVTARCNLDCAHCYINAPADDQDARRNELSREEFRDIFDQIVDEGCLWLLLTGGEPFIRPDFLDIYTDAKKRGLLITLFTNGTTITPRIADYLAEWCPFAVEISIYGRTEETHERVTGVSGSYHSCIRGIELLLERNIPLRLKTMVMTLNRHELWDLKAWAEELGVEFRFDAALNMRTDGGQAPGRLRLPPEEVVALDLHDEKRIGVWREFWEKFSGPPPRPETLYQCGAGRQAFHIDSYGQLGVCALARTPAYDLRRGTFREGWWEFVPEVLAQKWSQPVPCQTCELLALCGQCPGWSQTENGCPDKPVEYLCRIAHLRAEAFGFDSKTKGETSHGGKGALKPREEAVSHTRY